MGHHCLTGQYEIWETHINSTGVASYKAENLAAYKAGHLAAYKAGHLAAYKATHTKKWVAL